MRIISLVVMLVAYSISTPTYADNPTPPSPGACNPFILDMANIGKVSLATYLAMSSIYGPRVVTRLGSFVGGTPLVGATLIGLMGSQGAAQLLNKYVFYDNTESDSMARIGTYTGAVVGTVVSAGAILAATSAAPVATAATASAATSATAIRVATDALVTPIVAAVMFGVLAYETNCMLSE